MNALHRSGAQSLFGLFEYLFHQLPRVLALCYQLQTRAQCLARGLCLMVRATALQIINYWMRTALMVSLGSRSATQISSRNLPGNYIEYVSHEYLYLQYYNTAYLLRLR